MTLGPLPIVGPPEGKSRPLNSPPESELDAAGGIMRETGELVADCAVRPILVVVVA